MKKFAYNSIRALGTAALVGATGFLGYTAYAKFAPKAPCSAPIQYRIGTIDPRFGVTQSQLLDDLHQAAAIWSAAAGKNLFQYSASGTLPVSLVYDTRQQTTQKEAQLNSAISHTGQTAASVKAQYTSLEASYAVAEKNYSADLAAFNQAQGAYNSQVDYWNAHGGAPQAQYAALNATESSLESDRTSLENERQALNVQADQINALINQYNSLVGNINATVQTINTDGLTGTQFEQGVYISDNAGTRINIYQFDNKTSFVRVLAHELGHSLGLQHDTGMSSIMNPINSASNLSLSAEDIAELKAECKLQ